MSEEHEKNYNQKWFAVGYEKGREFARYEADYDELAAICRAGGIPKFWDIFRAEILSRYLREGDFDFASYEAGFTRACVEFFERL